MFKEKCKHFYLMFIMQEYLLVVQQESFCRLAGLFKTQGQIHHRNRVCVSSVVLSIGSPLNTQPFLHCLPVTTYLMLLLWLSYIIVQLVTFDAIITILLVMKCLVYISCLCFSCPGTITGDAKCSLSDGNCSHGISLRPCCVGLYGQCYILSQQNCLFFGGHWHDDQVSTYIYDVNT